MHGIKIAHDQWPCMDVTQRKFESSYILSHNGNNRRPFPTDADPVRIMEIISDSSYTNWLLCHWEVIKGNVDFKHEMKIGSSCVETFIISNGNVCLQITLDGMLFLETLDVSKF